MCLFLRLRVVSLSVLICACALCGEVARSQPLPQGSSAISTQPGPSPQTNTAAAGEAKPEQSSTNYILIPGPLRPFLRMSGISQQVTPDQVLPLFGHFVETYGFEGSKEKSPKATEALLIFRRYFVQANTLASLAGAKETLGFSDCENSRQLLADLGYKLENG